jgi:chromosome segregation ATPase
VVNTLVRSDETARVRLAELSERLRDAHASMDGARIRELSAAQRKLIEELVRAAFAATEIKNPSAALRDDVTGTLQAAIADPEIAGRLGTLTKAEQWSGFGDFGVSSAVVASPKADAPIRTARKPEAREPKPAVPSGPSAAEVRAARKKQAAAAADVEAAQEARAEAVEALSDRKAELKSARRRYEKLLESLHAAERELNEADAERAAAEKAADGAAERLAAAKSALEEADSELAALTGGQAG